jgi:ubiquinone/menaquinone biosynthesis C-methylase UbiE
MHSDHFKEHILGGKHAKHAKTWLNVNTVDAWRHRRMYHLLDPLLMADKKAMWLTVGDGRYGNDAKYIQGMGGNVIASDISDYLLKEAQIIGYIKEYKKENAEQLSFHDEQFDYVLCKESYHHFPRPMLALYEMLRVSRKGVVIIEPNDFFLNFKFIDFLFFSFKKILNFFSKIKIGETIYESSGNFIYTISKREIEKVALGLDYDCIAFKGINDIYLEGVEFEMITDNGPLYKKISKKIKVADFLCNLKLKQFGFLCAIIFKKNPSYEMISCLTEMGYTIKYLPKNPYSRGKSYPLSK